MRLLIFLLVTFLSGTSSLAQEITLTEVQAFADKLVAKEILTPKGREELLQQAKNKTIEAEHPSTVKAVYYTSSDLSKEVILQFCSEAFSTAQSYRILKHPKIERKIKQEDSLWRTAWTFYPGFWNGKPGADYIHPRRSTIGLTRTRTLNDFKEIGIISDRVYNECLAGLKDSSILDETELLKEMTKRSMYYRYYDFNKKEQLEYIDQLVEIGLLTRESKKALQQSYKEYELKTIPEMLQYSDRYVLVDLTAYEPNPEVIYPFIFQHIKKLVPGFDFTNLQVEVKEGKETDLIRQDIKLSFTIDGSTYSHLFFHDYKRAIPDPDRPERQPSKVDQDFHKAVNKWLSDKESPYRLYTVNIHSKGDQSPYGGEKTGLLLLKQGEAEKISSDPYDLSRESFDNRLSRKNSMKLVHEFTQQGLFSHLSQPEIDTAMEKIATGDINSINELLYQFPKTIVLFDWETGNLENPYEDLTKQFVQASRGAFTVSDIVDEFKKGWKKAKTLKYAFTMNGKRYERMLTFNDDWLDPAFLELLKTALKENNIDGGIYYCIDNGQEGGYIFLTGRQHKFILDNYPDLLKSGN